MILFHGVCWTCTILITLYWIYLYSLNEDSTVLHYKKYYNDKDPRTGEKLNFYKVKNDEIGNYVGQFKNSQRHGVGLVVLAAPSSDRNIIIEG